MTFLDEIEAFLEATNMPTSMFGKAVCKNPSLVNKIREGRQCGKTVQARARAYMEAKKGVIIVPRVSVEENQRRSVKPNQHIVRHRTYTVIDREPCGFCGVRRDLGCNHYQKSEPVRIT